MSNSSLVASVSVSIVRALSSELNAKNYLIIQLNIHYLFKKRRDNNMKNITFTLLTIATASISIATTAFAEGNHSGGHNTGHNDDHANAHWMSPPAAAKKPNPVKSDPASIDRGKKTYFQNCASCHGAKAKGDGPASAALKPKPADLTVMAGMHPDGDFAWKIANGRGAMPAWKGILSQTQIWELVNYIQNLNPGGKKKMMNMGDMKNMDHSKMNMGNMDHSKMNMEDMQKMMKKNMPNMDHSKMSKEDMQKMMGNMKMGKGNTAPNQPMNDHDKPHSH